MFFRIPAVLFLRSLSAYVFVVLFLQFVCVYFACSLHLLYACLAFLCVLFSSGAPQAQRGFGRLEVQKHLGRFAGSSRGLCMFFACFAWCRPFEALGRLEMQNPRLFA